MAQKQTVVTQVQRLVPSRAEITNSEDKAVFWSTMLRFWRLPAHITHFPGANPVSIERKDFPALQTDDFLAALKTDGVRYMLLLTKTGLTGEPNAVMIDRSKRMFEIQIWANEDFFEEGSLYDGELVWEHQLLTFIVFDVIRAKGVSCLHLSYRERMQVVHNTILCVGDSHSDESIEHMIAEECKFLARNNDHDFCIVPKKCVPKAALTALWSERHQSKHRNDGVIFTLNSASVETGTSLSILKWKPTHSIDVRVELDASGRWHAYANKNNSSEFIEIEEALAPTPCRIAPSKLLDVLRSRQPCILECAIHVDDGSDLVLLCPERERTDKPAPNTVKTICATIRNAQENITCEDLLRVVDA